MLGGFISSETMGAVGGAVAAGIIGPMISRYLPASLGGNIGGQLIGSAIVGLAGWFALKRISKSAALTFVGATIGPVVASLVPRNILPAPTQQQGMGYAYDDVEGLGEDLGTPGGLPYYGQEGMGQYSEEQFEYA